MTAYTNVTADDWVEATKSDVTALRDTVLNDVAILCGGLPYTVMMDLIDRLDALIAAVRADAAKEPLP